MHALRTVADLMAVAARTAPKTRGEDFIAVEILEGDAVERLGEAMIQRGEEDDDPGFLRDGRNVQAADLVVLVGLKDAEVPDLNCGACGEPSCIVPNTFEGEFRGPNCALRLLDMGIALGSAVKMAGMMNVDNRIMYRAGAVARATQAIDADFVLGIPLSSTGKSPYFDRPRA
jgi:uncharacterized ferredoxin-like protein